MRKRYVLKNKKRFCVFITFMLMSMFTVISATSAYGYKEPAYKLVTVRSGDTLWDIAQKYNKKGDIREYIYEVMKINNLDNGEILEGTELKVIVE